MKVLVDILMTAATAALALVPMATGRTEKVDGFV
jgi:Cu/Ag efflux pump CusA